MLIIHLTVGKFNNSMTGTTKVEVVVIIIIKEGKFTRKK